MTDAPHSPPGPGARTAARARELLVLATLLATVLWTIALVDASFGDAGRGGLSGRPVGTDFVNFYTLAHVGHTGRYDRLATVETFHAEQVRVVPDAADLVYPPIYPPQLALMLAPLARQPYAVAYLIWTALTIGGYATIVWRLAASSSWLRPWPRQVLAVAAASPALWFTVMHGQVSAIALVGFFGAWAALSKGRPWLAGMAVGLLAFKPSLFVPALALLLAAREWRMAAGAVLAVGIVTGATLPVVGSAAMMQYVAFTADVLRSPDRVASNPALMHSLRTFWSPWLPGPLATGAYAIGASALVLWAARVWRQLVRPLDRVALASGVVATASPHLFAYDLLILTPLVVAAADRMLAAPQQRWLGRLTYVGFLAPVWGVPLAALGVQASTPVLVAWIVAFAAVAREVAIDPSDTS